MKKNLRFIIGIISLILFVLILAEIIYSAATGRLIDYLEGDYGVGRQINAVAALIFNVIMLITGIINIIMRNSSGKKPLITISCIYGFNFILFILASGSYGIMAFNIGGIFSLICAALFIIIAIKQKKPSAYLIKCPLCDHDVSSESKLCQNCGHKVKVG